MSKNYKTSKKYLIFREIEKIMDIFKIAVDSQYVLASVIISLTILQITKGTDDLYKSASSFIYLAAIVNEFFILCVGGQLVSIKVTFFVFKFTF